MEIQDIMTKIASLEADRKNIFHQLDEIKEEVKDIHRLTSSVERLVEKMDSTAKKVDKIDLRLEDIEHEPKDDYKHYKRVIYGCIITGILGALIGAAIAFIIK